ncbi:hypothetical protein [Effusibacillus pohliae]|uniref:hypothetical protein n=1 Tax=Effusibacillus pohliae TaxID=232270 RepID=UPI00037F0DF9|nr:hypothetical protein [Effusibacillus pohliae]
MYETVLTISILLLAYGCIRYGIAKWRREPNPSLHTLWIPAAAFFYAACVSVFVWIF